ncbi:hypothetical protein [uncultured Bacteroides sp.]|jgi:septal ring factor EnvC (AmiA/AmiB activator)|uniref:hypothetical protein n=1 Tax=uncultured Bacteroides sp. TaxID=162156 RepID=UPI0025B64D8D|nr:hypothetical protein [uncultured Bacteroides sp.]
MNHKTAQEKQQSHTSIKIVSTILCFGIIVSVIFNIYQFNSNDALRSEVAALQSNIQTLETESDTLHKEIESKQTTMSELSLQIEDLNTAIETLKAENQGLSDSLKALEERQKEEAAVKADTSEIAESDTKVQESKPSSNNNGGGGSTTPSGSDGQKLMDALKQLGVDTSKDVSEDYKNATPVEHGGHRSSGEGIEAY